MTHARFLALALAAALAGMTSGCSTSSSGLKAKTVPPSAFLGNPGRLKPHRERTPFNLSWENPRFEARRSAYEAIAVAPVTTAYLRPVDRPLVTALEGPKAKDRPVAATAGLLRKAFTEALKPPGTRYKITTGSGPRVLALELALVEMNPTNVVGNVARYGAPGGSVLAPATKGNIAIEGRLRDSVTGEVLYEFADNEQDKFAIVSLRDLSSYGHARTALKDWAKQFAEFLRTARSHKVEDSSTVTLNPF